MKSLVVYFSYSGNTRRLAEDIALIIDCDIREIVPQYPYSFSYNTAVKEVRHEIETHHCPKLVSGLESVDNYDVIFIGSPNWLKTFAPPIRTFITEIDLSGKIIVPFCTHGGGGFGNIVGDYRAILSDTQIVSEFHLDGSHDFDNIELIIDELYKSIGEYNDNKGR